jgi:hypothetical protein
MKLAIAVLSLAFFGAVPAAADELPSSLPPAPVATPAAPAAGPASSAPSAEGWGDGKASKQPRMLAPDDEASGPLHVAWVQVGLAIVIMAAMAAFVAWLVRRHPDRRRES